MNEIDRNHTSQRVTKIKLDSSNSINNPLNSESFGKIYNSLVNAKDGLHIYLSKNEDSDKISTSDMNIEEYKQHIDIKIHNIARHSSQERINYTIHITDEGVCNMKENFEYEEYILQSIQSILQKPFEGAFAENCFLYFGAKKEDNYGMNWGKLDDAKRESATMGNIKEKKKKGKRKFNTQWNNENIEKKYNNLLDKEKELSNKIKKYEDFLFVASKREDRRPHTSKITSNTAQLAKAYYAYNIAKK